MIALEAHDHGVILPVLAKPGSRRNELAGVHDGMLRVSVTQSPEKGKANTAIISLLGKKLSLAKSRFEILAGETSSRKRILVTGLEAENLREKLTTILSET